ncbi:ABC transporter ATP-binding protein [Aliirhizobium cellulosilyticum]|uniref:Glutathione import ATP-binding protein GsiA n=1 Tax=Aliirhizobium cellulosilyticum TaxID=393664 RepID=A0A7W6Y3M8_9HYPH|nr:ABC transporter ATP-binding protein [Rhizobium cellulosilyticum]MBB4346306.1 peptide/nickel transport system ATP-binding protein [Rhizobium cellulosilyticum]MBB4411300.1 peptide/nickel transport system ATP-binding protein [Rhizobium cellulosilyticum]MBB4445989.1 peptide/nickel transport system ATP-binding protein [Rhizobium cellulosilyticum]
MSAPVMTVSGLKTSFRRKGVWLPVVRDVSFDIHAGETLALVGESGSGKSVTAMSIMRLYAPETCRIEGSVKLEGQELTTLPERRMRDVRGDRIAMIFQEPMTSLNPSLTIGDQISEVLVAHRGLSLTDAMKETRGLLEKVRIPSAAKRLEEYPHQMSGGMRQRIMIAMALACRPKLLIADEPTTALDVTIQAQILELIKLLQEEEGMAVLFITHDMGVVAEIANRTLVMYKGEAIERGQTEQIFAEPQRGYTKALLSAVPKLGSMQGEAGPARFPLVDVETGVPVAMPQVKDTVSAEPVPLLQVSDLVTRFDIGSGFLGSTSGRVHAVESVSFDLKAGETLALVGESGCGKSTTGRTIIRLQDATSGSVKFDGKEILGLTGEDMRAMRRHIQMIFQDPFASLNPRIQVGDAVAEPLLAHKIASGKSDARDRVADLMVKVGLQPDMASRFPHEFSGGQRQRLCIARALAMAPQIIVADEAVSALDVSIKAQVINLMLDLQENMGLSYLFISHDMAVVERMSHRVAVMYLGEIVEIGPRQAIFENPQHPYTKRLLAAVPIPDPARRGIRRGLSNEEIKSPVRSLSYVPPKRDYVEVSPGHFVQSWGDEWGNAAAAA